MSSDTLKARKKIDPITFEVLRHRLWSINNEQSTIGATISGSPVIYESFDLNSSIMTPEGEALFAGVYVIMNVPGLEITVKNIVREYSQSPGIFDGDMFITNDPWWGPMHMNDVAVVSPIFRGGKIICWTGIVMHDLDVGSPVPGSFAVGARDVFGEAPLIPPQKIVDRGEYRKDVENLVVRNSRTRNINLLNIRARIASQNIARKLIDRVIDTYGEETFVAFQEELKRYVAESFRARLRDLPDGTWAENGYIDHDGNNNILYELKLAMTKKGDELTFDFRGTSPQAPGIVNCTRSGLEGGIFGSLLPMLCFDIPWSTAALRQVINIVSDEGTINNAAHPAAVSMASIGPGWLTCNLVTCCLAKMLACSEKYKDEVQACWFPGWNVVVIDGIDDHNNPVTGLLMEAGAGGAGARSYSDGIDNGGYICTPCLAIPNVETTELRYPILQIYRKQSANSFGHGKYRGGVGIEFLNVAHNTAEPVTVINALQGLSQPGAPGIYGGFPSSVQGNLILRGSNIEELFAQGIIPTSSTEIRFESESILAAKDMSQFGGADLLLTFVAGGGGYGDPLFRLPEAVRADAQGGLCSKELAESIYGVVLDTAGAIDTPATERKRKEIRTERLGHTPTAEVGRGNGHAPHEGIVGEHTLVVRKDGQFFLQCAECGFEYGDVSSDPKLKAVRKELPITETSPRNRYGLVDTIRLVQYFCPDCATAIAVNVQKVGDPILMETTLGAPLVSVSDKSVDPI